MELFFMSRDHTERPQQFFSLKIKLILLAILVCAGFFLPRLMAVHIVNSVKIGSPLYKEISRQKEILLLINEMKSEINFVRAESFNLSQEPDAAKREKIEAVINETDARIETRFSRLEQFTRDPELLKKIVGMKKDFVELDEVMDAKLEKLVEQGLLADAHALLGGEQADRFTKIAVQLDELIRQASAKVLAAEAEAETIMNARLTEGVLISLVLFVIAAGVMFSIASATIRSVRRGSDFANEVSNGDLTSTLPVIDRDELGVLTQSLNRMVENLNRLTSGVMVSAGELLHVSGNLQQAATQVTHAVQIQKESINTSHAAVESMGASISTVSKGMDLLTITAQESSTSIQEIVASIESVANTVEILSIAVEEVSSSIIEMAASLKQVGSSISSLVDVSSLTTSSIFQMDASIRQVLENAADTASIASGVLEDAENGRRSVQATVVGMKEIHRASSITSEVIDTLSAKTNDIGTILSVINEVAEQTNLLALNAAIIASQAGEHGKGFAVVADEIRELAERTKSSTQEIGQVIKSVQHETSRAVDAIQAAEKAISDGETLSLHSGDALEKIVRGIQQASKRMAQIAVATEEQGKGSQVIRDAAGQFADMVHQIAMATDEQSRSSVMIINAAERMKSLTLQVRVASQEQNQFGQIISQSTARVMNMIEAVGKECSLQRKESEIISHAMEAIRSTNSANLNSSSVMNEAVATLSEQVEALQTEIRRFKLKS